jgi:uncharacterized protein (DUF952 family)
MERGLPKGEYNNLQGYPEGVRMLTAEMIYHITTEKAWKNALQSGQYVGDTLETEGFIHFSGKEQVVATANRYYQGTSGLLLLQVVVKRLACKLKYEAGPSGELFPHLYGPLNMDAVEKVSHFKPESNGNFVSLPE